MSTKVVKNQIIGLKELRLDTEKYIDQVEKGASFVVVRRSKPIFRLSKVEEEWESVADFSSSKGGGVSAEVLLQALKKNK